MRFRVVPMRREKKKEGGGGKKVQIGLACHRRDI